MRNLKLILGYFGAGIAFVILCVWLGPIVFRGHVTTVSSELNLASLIATLMGGVMAAAGLVVALVSVVSFRTLDQRVEDKFQQLVRDHNDDQRTKTNSMFQGFSLQLQAISTLNLYEAEKLTEYALSLYPDLEGSRRQLALRFFNTTEDSLVSKFTENVLGRSQARFAQGVLTNSYPFEAEKWLERAREHDEDKDKYLTFCLAKLYGMRGRYDLMMEAFQDSLSAIDCEDNIFEIIVASAYACDSEPRLQELSNLIKVPLPISKESFFEAVNKNQDPITSRTFLCRKKMYPVFFGKLPSIYRVRVNIDSKGGYRLDFLGDDPKDVHRAPTEEDSTKWFTEEEAWNVLMNEGWVLCQIDPTPRW